MVSSDEINRRLEAKRRGVKYQEVRNDRNFRTGGSAGNSKECPYCQTQNPSTAKFCVGCGRKLETPIPEKEKGFSPEIKGPETAESTEEIEKPIKSGTQISHRPDDFGGASSQRIQSSPPSEKLEPIVPKSPEPEHDKTIESAQPTHEPETTSTPEPKPPEPPQVKRPKTIPTPKPQVQKTETEEKSKSDVDPVERIKKAKELLDLGAITQEEYDMIKSKYLDEI